MIASNTTQSISIPLNWLPVLVKGKGYPWHRSSPKHWPDRELIEGPRVYRWAFKNKAGDIKEVYIGQSEAFQKRIAKYRKPTKAQTTDALVHGKFVSCEEQEGKVELQFLKIERFEINGQPVDASCTSLGNHDVRLLLESVALITAMSQHPNPVLLNRLFKNVHEKNLENLLQSKFPGQRENIQSAIKHLDEIR